MYKWQKQMICGGTYGTTGKKQEKNNEKTEKNGYQLSFIQLDDPTLLDIRDRILNIDIDTLTPIEALFKLNEIKKIVKKK